MRLPIELIIISGGTTTMIKTRPMTVAALVATAVVAGAVTASPALAADNGSADTAKAVRISGADRYATAIQASVKDFPAAGSAQGVVIARGDLYVDALAGTPLATAKQAALLLTDGSSLTPGVAAEIQRALGSDTAKTITILGGPDAVSPQVEAQLKALGHPVDRIGGADRYATTLDIAQASGAKSAVVATGADFADPLVAGVYAAHTKGALLMTDGAKLSLPTARTLLEMPNLSTTTLFGGPEALTPSVQQSIDTVLANVPQIQTLRDFPRRPPHHNAERALAVCTLGEAANATPAEQAAISTFTLKWADVSTAYDQYQQAAATAHRSDTRASDAQRAIDDAIAKLIGS